MASKKELKYLEAKDAYYKGEPIMTDSEFDALEIELKRSGSPIVNMVGRPSGRSMKYEHPSKMLSLEKIKLDDEDFDRQIRDFLSKYDSKAIRLMPKFDGNAINVIYENGRLMAGITRGDGQRGVNVTNKIRRAVPNRIDVEDKVEIRGEVTIDLPRFNKDFSEEFKNARNFVAGVLNKDNNDVTTLNSLKFLPLDVRVHTDDGMLYSLYDHPDTKKEKYDNELDLLEDEGFTRPPKVLELSLSDGDDLDELRAHLEDICTIREDYEENSFPYLVDGAVIRFDDHNVRKYLGESNHSPNWALAVKLPAVEKSTIIKKIEWNVGHTGKLVPVGILEPVEIDGSVISRVTLHNYGWMTERKCYPGAVVKIIKSGDIIPKVVEILKEGKYLDLDMNCPECGSQLIIKDIHLKCVNGTCKARVVRNLENGFDALGFDYFGASTCESLYEAGVESILDFVEPGFDKEELVSTEEFKDGRFLERIMSQYDKLENIQLHKLVLALNFEKVGPTIAKKIAKTYAGLDVDWSGIDSNVVERFEYKYVASSDGFKGFDDKAFSDPYAKVNQIVAFVTERGYDIQRPQPETEDEIKFEMTGSPKSHGFKTKSEFKKRLKGHNTRHTSLAKADYLVTENMDSKSSKMKKARDKGLEIVTYSDLINILDEG